jgi:hypothetical protein
MPTSRHDASGPRLDGLRALIAQGSEADPLIGVKVGSEQGLEWLLNHLKTERGVHAETLMATAGALAGTSAQAALWEEAGGLGGTGQAGLQLVRCHDGSSYWVGEPINRRLVEGYGSPWHVLSETARQAGCQSLPSAETLLLQGLQRLGTPAFGHPQVPAEHTPQVLDASEREQLWRLVKPLCETCCEDPTEWPLLCGLLAARALRLVTTALTPDLAFRLAMESAIDAARRPLIAPTMAP